MELASSNISILDVRNILGHPSTDLGTLCTSKFINPFSRWKPINANVSTMTYNTLVNNNFGLTILNASTPAQLLSLVQNNANKGFIYNRPTGGANSLYRLGDFRNYNHSCSEPIEAYFKTGDEKPIGGLDASYSENIVGMEMREPEDTSTVTYLCRKDLYPTGLNKGAYMTDGTNSCWSVGGVPWGVYNWQQFKNREVLVLEFLTNVEEGTTHLNYQGKYGDLFYALPYPISVINVTSDLVAGSKDVWIKFTDVTFIDSEFSQLKYNFCFSSIGEAYRGGTLTNVWIGLYTEKECLNYIARLKIADSITVGSETTSSQYSGILLNRLNREDVYFGVHYNNKLQYYTLPMFSKLPEQ